MITEALGNLVNTLSQVQDRKRELESQDMMLLLGSKFVNEIQATTDTTTLSTAMLKANKIAFSLGMPELASSINNLGQIKQQELTQGKSDRLSLQQAQAYRNLYGKQSVLVNGEYKRLDTIDDFNQGKDLDPGLQVQYYQQVVNKYTTELKKGLDISKGMDKPMVRITASRKDGTEEKVLSEIYRSEIGWTEKLLSENTEDLTSIPQEVIQHQNKMIEEQFKSNENDRRFNRRQGAINARSDKPGLKEVRFTDGTTGFAIWAPGEGEYGKFRDTKTGEDITDNVIGKGYKQTNDASDIKNADVTNADKKKNQAANELFNQLRAEGKVPEDLVTKYTNNGYTNSVALLNELNGNENAIEGFANTSQSVRMRLDEYRKRVAHSKLVSDANALRQSGIIKNESVIETPAQKAKRIYGIK